MSFKKSVQNFGSALAVGGLVATGSVAALAQANPGAPRAMNPCAAKSNSSAAKSNPCAAKANPCAAKSSPCSAKEARYPLSDNPWSFSDDKIE